MTPPLVCIRCRHAERVISVREASYCTPCYARVFDEKLRASLDHARGAILLHSVVRPHQQATADTADLPHVQGSNVAQNMPTAGAPATPASAPEPAYAVACDGSLNSLVLVHTMYRLLYVPHARAHPTPARAPERARLDVLYVATDLEKDAAQASSSDGIREQVARLAPDAIFVPLTLGHAYAHDEGVSCHVHPPCFMDDTVRHVDAQDAAVQLLRAVGTSVSRLEKSAARTRAEDIRRILWHRVLHDTAQSRQCAALLFPNDATQTAAYVLDALAKGAGYKLPVEGAASLWIQDVLHLHPLSVYLPHELAFYARQHQFDSAVLPDTRQESDMSYEALSNKSSMGALSQSLITALQHGVSSTSNTVIGTASKLVLQDASTLWPTKPDLGTFVCPGIGAKGATLVRSVDALPHWDFRRMRSCPLCRFPAQTDAVKWKSDRSIRREQPRVASINEALNLNAHLCYACLQVLDIPAGSTFLLPSDALFFVRAPGRPASVQVVAAEPGDSSMRDALALPHTPRSSHAPTRVPPEAMREQVASFLLDKDTADST